MTADVLLREFPFVKELPKREKSKLAKFMDAFNEARALVDQHGMLVPPVVAAKVGGVSRQRIQQLCDEGRLVRIYLNEQPFITEDSLIEWAKSERANGVKLNLPETKREALKRAVEVARRK